MTLALQGTAELCNSVYEALRCHDAQRRASRESRERRDSGGGAIPYKHRYLLQSHLVWVLIVQVRGGLSWLRSESLHGGPSPKRLS